MDSQTQQPIVSSSVPSSPTPASHHRAKSRALLVIIIILALAAIGFFLFRDRSLFSPQSPSAALKQQQLQALAQITASSQQVSVSDAQKAVILQQIEDTSAQTTASSSSKAGTSTVPAPSLTDTQKDAIMSQITSSSSAK